MKTFTVIDCNKPLLFATDCVACVLDQKKNEQLEVYTVSGQRFSVGPQMLYDLRLRLYNRILEAAKTGGTVIIPDFNGMNEDLICQTLEELTIEP